MKEAIQFVNSVIKIACENLKNFGVKSLQYIQTFVEHRYVSLWFIQLSILYEQGFSTLLTIKSKQKNRLDPNDDMRLALCNNIFPRLPQLVKKNAW